MMTKRKVENALHGAMRTSCVLWLVLVPAGCNTSEKRTALSAMQAQTLAVQLANDKADTLFHRRPFQGEQPAHLEHGRWIWTDSRGVGLRDFRARVELAADGSTNFVDVILWDSALDRQR
jgi:hypothetical protein